MPKVFLLFKYVEITERESKQLKNHHQNQYGEVLSSLHKTDSSNKDNYSPKRSSKINSAFKNYIENPFSNRKYTADNMSVNAISSNRGRFGFAHF